MSWLARSLASSLRLSPFEEEQEPTATSNREPNTESESESESDNSNRTVQEDLSDLTQTLSRQFWGVASLLSTQNANPGSSTSDDHAEIAGSPRIDGIKNDFAEIGNQFKSSISLFSNAKVVTEVSKMATSLLQFGSEEEDIDEEVVVFVKNLSMHPKTWLDFPEFDAGGK
ncbi:hypothetical protein FCM35_KLT22425 [Carex littledalei]|uniref:BSD domain-containing protein n=1 Tax=Carex littledalei TaxID=544730 RepID=A0A833QFS8_9POAL|nr:hypothetical protein FCM35_KLT22425 [Carex littledalei]